MMDVTRHDDGTATITAEGQGQLDMTAEQFAGLLAAAKSGQLDRPNDLVGETSSGERDS